MNIKQVIFTRYFTTQLGIHLSRKKSYITNKIIITINNVLS